MSWRRDENARYVRSAASRSLGPNDDPSSGVDFIVRTIGHQIKNKGAVLKADESDEDDDAGSDAQDAAEDADNAAEDLRDGSEDPATMSLQQLRKVFGKDAESVSAAFFQHSNKITAAADFRSHATKLQLTAGSRGTPRIYRKGQLEPSVFFRAIEGAVTSSSVPLSPQEVFVNFTGGTPECIVGALIAGFQLVCTIHPPEELPMMQLPEDLMTTRFESYTSPDPEQPLLGVLASEGVRWVAKFMRNAVFKVPNVLTIPQMQEITVPPLRVFNYIQAPSMSRLLLLSMLLVLACLVSKHWRHGVWWWFGFK